MSIVVPFDGTPLSRAALARADTLRDVFGEEVFAITIVPNRNVRYARERGWLADDEPFDPETIVTHLSQQVTEISPGTEFEYEVVDRYAPAGAIASRIRTYARSVDANLVVLGSDNAGRIVTNVSSVSGAVAADKSYDVLIVRTLRPE